MSKFNSKAKDSLPVATTNVAGGVSYERNDFKKELAAVVFNSMLNGKDSYYETEKDRIERIFKLVGDNAENGKFLAKTLVYTRNEIGLRSVSHVLAVALTENVKAKSFVRKALFKSIVRPDDMLEIFSLWKTRNKNAKMSNAMRRAFKDSLESSFDEYQLKKYENKNSEVKLADIVKLTHPDPKNFKDKLVFKRIIEGSLKKIETAQTVNSGSVGKERAENYSKMLKDKKLGILAALKNVKNMLEAGIDDEAFDMLCNMFKNEKLVLNSKILPFRFYDAYEEVEKISKFDQIKLKKVLKAIETGFSMSAKNVPLVEDGQKVFIGLDESGSMGGGKGSPFEIGKILMASMLSGLDKDNTIGYLWADRQRKVDIDSSPMEFIKKTRTQGGSTYVSATIEKLLKTKTYVDVIVIFTDMQMYGYGGSSVDKIDDYLNKYKNSINKNVKVVWWNLQGYAKGTPSAMKFGYEVSGYSDKMLDVVGNMLRFGDSNYLVKVIENYVDL